MFRNHNGREQLCCGLPGPLPGLPGFRGFLQALNTEALYSIIQDLNSAGQLIQADTFIVAVDQFGGFDGGVELNPVGRNPFLPEKPGVRSTRRHVRYHLCPRVILYKAAFKGFVKRCIKGGF